MELPSPPQAVVPSSGPARNPTHGGGARSDAARPLREPAEPSADGSKKVSVLLTTYNHEPYITRAVESALAQRVNFDYEIVLGEDASSDRTREISVALAEKHPDTIRLLLSDRGQAEAWRARGLGGKANFVRVLDACRGDYVAWLDGDDYWTDNRKLQKQVDFLDQHPECAICFHDVLFVHEDESHAPARWSSLTPLLHGGPAGPEAVWSLEDLLGCNYLPSPSIMFRNHLYGELPGWFYETQPGDWPLMVINAAFGQIGYLNEVMAVNWRHEGSFCETSYGGRPAYTLLVECRVLERLNAHFDFKYDELIRASQLRRADELDQRIARLNDLSLMVHRWLDWLPKPVRTRLVALARATQTRASVR